MDSDAITNSATTCAGMPVGMPPTDTRHLAAAIREFETKLPGWVWSIGRCRHTRDAWCAPDVDGPDRRFLRFRKFDNGFSHISRETPAATLRAVMNRALQEKELIAAMKDPAKEIDAHCDESVTRYESVHGREFDLRPPTNTKHLSDAIVEFETVLPGWWWWICPCLLTRDASCGPSNGGPDEDLLKFPEFDAGFHYDTTGTLASSLRDVMRQALRAKRHLHRVGGRLLEPASDARRGPITPKNDMARRRQVS
jgi:hypothetical protein